MATDAPASYLTCPWNGVTLCIAHAGLLYLSILARGMRPEDTVRTAAREPIIVRTAVRYSSFLADGTCIVDDRAAALHQYVKMQCNYSLTSDCSARQAKAAHTLGSFIS